MLIPHSKGKLFLAPKLTAEAIAKIVFGPGVTDADIENITTEIKYSIKAPVQPILSITCYILR